MGLFPIPAHGSTPPASTNAYYDSKIEAHGERALPVILGTDGTIYEETKRHPEERESTPEVVACDLRHGAPEPWTMWRSDAATDARPETAGAQ